MPSKESAEIRKSIVKDAVREDATFQEQHAEWEAYARSLPLPEGIECEEERIAGVPCLWVRDEQSSSQRAIVHIHGGGLTVGSPITHREFAARLVKTVRIPVLLADYRLAPEFPFPAALQDVQAVYRELLQERFQSQNLIFGGDSSGAGLALAALILLRDAGDPLPASGFFISGSFDSTLSGESMSSRAELDPFTSQEVLAHCARHYAQNTDLRDPLISPLFADLSGLPPFLILVGDHEILLSDSTRLAEKIERAGGVADLKVWDSMWHTWPMYADFPEAREALEAIRDFLHQKIS